MEDEYVNLLFVDNYEPQRNLAESVLEGEDHIDLDTASTLGEAEQKLLDGEYDAVVSNNNMDGSNNAADLLEEIEQSEKDIPFYIHTCNNISQLDLTPDDYSNCVVDYFQKDGLKSLQQIAEKTIECTNYKLPNINSQTP